MDLGSISGDMALGAVNQQVGTSVLKAVQNLDKTVAAELFNSIGLGGQIDVRA